MVPNIVENNENKDDILSQNNPNENENKEKTGHNLDDVHSKPNINNTKNEKNDENIVKERVSFGFSGMEDLDLFDEDNHTPEKHMSHFFKFYRKFQTSHD